MNVTRRQHHVWRSYLEAWATDCKIWCLQEGRIFNANVSRVAVERDFYKLHPLTDADIHALRVICDSRLRPMKELVEDFIYTLGIAGRLKAASPFASNPTVDAQLDCYIITAEEKLHARYEDGIKPVFDAIRRKDLSFYDDPALYAKFTHFLCLQNLRTNGVRERFLAAERERPSGFGNDFSAERCWPILAHFMAASAGATLLRERKKRPLLLLESELATPFITGDQPVVNLLGGAPGVAPQLLAFYYPVSPQLAVILDEMDERTGFQRGRVSVEQAKALNEEIKRAAYRQIFASSQRSLKPLL